MAVRKGSIVPELNIEEEGVAERDVDFDRKHAALLDQLAHLLLEKFTPLCDEIVTHR